MSCCWYFVCAAICMTIEDFEELSQAQRLEAIWNMGDFIVQYADERYRYELYSIQNFLVEVVSEKNIPGSFCIRLKETSN
jgi:hypothetical protein